MILRTNPNDRFYLTLKPRNTSCKLEFTIIKSRLRFRSLLFISPCKRTPMKTLSNNFMSRPFCLVVAAAFCLAGCSSPEQETSTPQQNDDVGVVEMEIKTEAAGSDTETAGSDTQTDDSSTAPDSGSSSKSEGSSNSGLSLTPPKS